MAEQKLPVKLLAGACALGMAVCGLFLGQRPPTPGAEEPPVPPVVEEENSEGKTLDSERVLKIICPRFATAADAFLLMTGESAVLIDTGEERSAATLLDLLRQNKVQHLDAMILTHFDKDHIGGASEVLDSLQVDKLYRTKFSTDSVPYLSLLEALERHPETEVITLTETVSFSLDGVSYTLYPPLAEDYSKNPQNNSSIITSVSCQEEGPKLLFMGDAEKARVKEYLSAQYDGTEYDLLKVPHHGRDPKPLERLLEAFVPAHAILTSSNEEREDTELLNALMREGVDTWLTREGTVTVVCGKEELTVQQDEG